MSRRQAAALLAAVAAATIGCTKLLNNRCDVNSDCASQNCNMETKVCVPAAGGAGGQGGAGGAGGAQGTGGMPFSCGECTGAKPICDREASTCQPCGNSTACQSLDAGTNACVPTDAGRPDGGATPGTCVECVWNGDCHLKTKPICVSNTCAPCTADSDCAGVGPSVCLATDGHCATDSETIYVQKSAACNDLPDGGSSGGTKTHPFCSMVPALSVVTQNRDLVVVDGTGGNTIIGGATYANEASPGQLTIVGQNGATIGSQGPPAFALTSGTVSIRSLTISQSSSNGISATGGTLNLDHVTVENCTGGIFIDGAAFDIENTTVTTNNAATFKGNINWAGILVNSTPDGGASILRLDSIAANQNAGLSCSTPVASSTGVLVYGNGGGVNIAGCNVTSCGLGPTDANASCGAQQ